MQYAVMIFLCLIVPAVMLLVLSRFVRTLRQIERERWGDKARSDTEESLKSAVANVLRLRKK